MGILPVYSGFGGTDSAMPIRLVAPMNAAIEMPSRIWWSSRPSSRRPVEIGVADRLRVVVHRDGQVGERTFAVGQLGDLVVVDRDPLTERPSHRATLPSLLAWLVWQYAHRFSPDTTVAITSRSRALSPPRPSVPSRGSR